MPDRPPLVSRIKDASFALLAKGLFAGMRALGVDRASNLGGWLGRTLGPLFPVSRIGRINLKLAFPEMPEAEREALLRKVWDNLGRVAAEYAHLDTITDLSNGRVEIEGQEHLIRCGREKTPGIFFSGHLAQWEVMHIMASRYGANVATMVRPPNNRYIADKVEQLRDVAGGVRLDKGSDGARKAIAHLKKGGMLAILIDQRLGQGVMVDFFGQPAETPGGMAQIALRYGFPLYPASLVRTGPGRFRMTVCDPMDPNELAGRGTGAGDGQGRDRVVALTQAMTAYLEEQIRAHPEGWLWLHRRWPREIYRKER